ncbi:hypothetical protein FKR81_08165 [Lentzea tibetensis]|uniref:PE domain-containing protein n=1 Tax=Lentzea tibetensis TaxID=2591470 RepID=A0A563EZY5_9PSEU|nr:hypothetical protein [Lentzea tibetensis]TWP53051.1 hypothetical protein FKR81_08165 [Lentzea tibetensis]
MAEDNAAAGALLGAVAGVGGAVGAAVGSLFAAEGALGRMLAGASGQKFEVDKGTVLQAGKVISDQATVLQDALSHAGQRLEVVVDDDVNKPIASAWNTRLVNGESSYAGRIQQYINSLDNLAGQLKEAAKQYGFTEDEVQAAFGDKGVQ